MTSSMRFLVALSYPGEFRSIVAQVASVLAGQLGMERVFYDKYYEAELARPNLDTYLQKIYHDESELLVIFIGADYEQKEWCGVEWRAIRDLLKQKQTSSIMYIRMDDGDVSGILSIDGFIDGVNRPAGEIAYLIFQRLQINGVNVNP